MKKLTLVILFTISSLSLLIAETLSETTKEFKVFGNCGMCKTRIEKAASSVEGVAMAEWNQNTKMLKVTFDSNKIEVLDIHKAVAKVGHDTEKVKTEDDVYNKLHGCCKYERKGI